MRFLSLLCVTLFVTLSHCHMTQIPCLGLLSDPMEPCTGKEIFDSLEQVELAHETGMIEEDNYQFMKTISLDDCDCFANLVNSFYGGMDGAADMEGLYAVIEDKCPGSDLSERIKKLYEGQHKRVESQRKRFPVCVQKMEELRTGMFSLFQKKNGQEKITPQEMLERFANFSLEAFKDFQVGLQSYDPKRPGTGCTVPWQSTFPATFKSLNSDLTKMGAKFLEKFAGSDKMQVALPSFIAKMREVMEKERAKKLEEQQQ